MKAKSFLPLVFPFIIWLVFTHPLIFDFAGSIYGDYLGDSAGLITRLNEGWAALDLGEVLAPCSLIFRLLSLFVPATAVYNLAVFLSFAGTFLAGFFFFSNLPISSISHRRRNFPTSNFRSRREQISAAGQFLNFSISLFFALVLTIAPIRLWYAFEWPNHAQWGFVLLYLLFLVRFLWELYSGLQRRRSCSIVPAPSAKPFSGCRLRGAIGSRSYAAVLSGLFFALALSENYYHGFMLFFLTLFALGFTVVYRRVLREEVGNSPESDSSRREESDSFPCRLLPFAIFALSALISSLPALYRFKFWVPKDIAGGGAPIAVSASRSPEDRFTYSARPWHYLIPDINHPILGDTALKIHKWIWSRPPYYLTERFFPKEHTLYLGLTLLLLSGYALFRVFCTLRHPEGAIATEGSLQGDFSPRTQRGAGAQNDGAERRLAILPTERFYILLFAFLAVVMMIFSFPPYVGVGGFKVYFPSHFLYQFFPQVRAYARFGALVFICNAVVASFGLKILLRHPERNEVERRISSSKGDSSPRVLGAQNDEQNCTHGKRRGCVVLALVFSAVIFEFLNFPPFHNISIRPPKVYQWLSKQEGDFAYLEYPTRIYYTDWLYQYVHGKRVLNPYHRTTPEVKKLVKEIDSSEFVSRFESLGGRYILFHRPEEKSEKQRAAESWGFPAWGTHAELPEAEETKNELYFRDDPRFREVYEAEGIIVFGIKKLRN